MQTSGDDAQGSQSRPSHAFAEGIELFNGGKYFAAHEVWESLWRNSSEPYRSFCQGLIQVAVALHHLQRRNVVGFRRLLGSGVEKLASYGPKYQGVHVQRLLLDLEELRGFVSAELGSRRGPVGVAAAIQERLSHIKIASDRTFE